MNAAIVFDRVRFFYPDAEEPALDDVSLSIEHGTFVLVAGLTGAGKSTLLRAVNGLVPHFTGGRFSGRVVVAGKDTAEFAPRDLADAVAYVPQQPDAAFVLDKVEDEIAYTLENLARSPAEIERRVEEALDLLHIADLRDRSVRTLSGGERQRVAIAAGLAGGARVLVLDEPTSQLDPQGAEDVLAALQRLVHDLGATVIASEHRLERIAGFADHAVACRAGGRVVAGSPRDVLPMLQIGPPVSRLGTTLGWEPTPLTVREARKLAVGYRLDSAEVGRASATSGAPETSRTGASTTRLVAGYGANEAIRGMDFEAPAGSVTAIIGRNGSGKTTLLRCIAGLHKPLRGTVCIGHAAPRAGQNVVMLPQDPDVVLFSETVRGEIAATLRAHGRDEAAVSHWMRALGLNEVADRHPRDLSAGERVLVAVAAVASVDTPVLLLDEPTRGLDPSAKQRLSTYLRAEAREGKTVAFASHDVEMVADLADQVVLLGAGALVAAGPPEEILADSAVFSPQATRVFGKPWLTVDQVVAAIGRTRP